MVNEIKEIVKSIAMVYQAIPNIKLIIKTPYYDFNTNKGGAESIEINVGTITRKVNLHD
jgi:hypothetical protein